MKGKKLNNSGSTLVGVLIVIAVVGILAASLCIMTMVNSQMKIVDRKAKDNFFSAETALDQITLGIQNDLAESTREAYGWLLVNYLDDSLTTEQKSQNFKKKVSEKFMAAMKSELDSTATYSNDQITVAIKDKLNGYLTTEMKTYADVEDMAGFVVDADSKYIIFKAVKVVYTNGSYGSIITTDIKITIPEAEFSVDLPYTSELPFQSYALMAKETLDLDTQDSLSLDGNLYVGGNNDDAGITVNRNGRLTLNSGMIINGGDIRLINTGTGSSEDDASLEINALKKTVNIWTKNIIVDKEGSVSPKVGYDLKAYLSNFYVADDLLLNSTYSRVSIQGAYTGYGSSSTDEKLSSAIIVNGSRSKLDLKGCTNLNIFGRAFISFPEFNGTSVVESPIPTGESLTVRGNQIAYLVPSMCVSKKHNPVSAADAARITASDFDLGACSFNSGKTLLDYCKTTVIAKSFRVRSGATQSTVVYYYLNFKDDADLSEFFMDYCDTFGTSGLASIFTLDGNNGLETCVDIVEDEEGNQTIVSTGSITAQGAVTAQYESDGTYKEDVITSSGAGSVGADSDRYRTQKSYLWASLKASEDSELKKAFEEKGISSYLGRDAVANLLDYKLLDDLFAKYGNTVEIYDPSAVDANDYRLIMVNNIGGEPYKLTGNKKGILIVTGDLIITNGAQFTGLIVCGNDASTPDGASGKVTMSAGESKLTASSDIVMYMLGKTDVFKFELKDENGDDKEYKLGELFMDPRAGQVSYVPEEEQQKTKDQDLSTMITFENWVKD